MGTVFNRGACGCINTVANKSPAVIASECCVSHVGVLYIGAGNRCVDRSDPQTGNSQGVVGCNRNGAAGQTCRQLVGGGARGSANGDIIGLVEQVNGSRADCSATAGKIDVAAHGHSGIREVQYNRCGF